MESTGLQMSYIRGGVFSAIQQVLATFGGGLELEERPIGLRTRVIDRIAFGGDADAVVANAVGLGEIVAQRLGYGYLGFGGFAQADADGVAYAVMEERTDAYGRLDTSVFAFTGFRHAQMQREVHVLAVHLFHEQTHRFGHDLRVAGFDGEDDIAELLIHRHAQKLHTTLHHARRRVAVARHDAVAEAAVVDTDAQGRVVLLADIEQADKPLTQTLQFGSILLVGVVDVLEHARRVNVVTRVDTHFLHPLRCQIRHVRVEMHVGDEWEGLAGFRDVQRC